MKYNGDKGEYETLKHLYREVNWQLKAQKDMSVTQEMPNGHRPNSVVDKVKDNIHIQRRYFGRTGKPRLDIDLTDHGNPKQHPIVHRYHGWRESQNGKMDRETEHDKQPELWHIIANKDILKEVD